jgi:Tfp pilus assembly protein PilN
MFTIDLLKGRGIPVRSGPAGIAIAVATFAVPIIAAIVMFGLYVSNGIAMSIQKDEIANYEKHIGTLSDAVELQKSFEKEKSVINSCLSEVASSTGRHLQWSPILVTLVKNMPDSVVLTGLEVKQHSIKRKVPAKDDPKKKIDINVPVRSLQMTLSGSPQSNCDKAVRDFRDYLLSSTLLTDKLEDIRVSQGFGTLDGQDAVSYEIDCIFKPEL